MAVAVALAVGVAVDEGLAVAEELGLDDVVGSAAGATAPAGAAKPEKRTPAPITATDVAIRDVRPERLISHMRSIITRTTGGGSNRGILGESVDSGESGLHAR